MKVEYCKLGEGGVGGGGNLNATCSVLISEDIFKSFYEICNPHCFKNVHLLYHYQSNSCACIALKVFEVAKEYEGAKSKFKNIL